VEDVKELLLMPMPQLMPVMMLPLQLHAVLKLNVKVNYLEATVSIWENSV
jgi:hypothetical protein